MIKPIDRVPDFAPKRREEQHDDGTWTVFVQPPAMFNLPEQCIRLSKDQYHRYKGWREGYLMIQEALPELTPAQREILLSGLADEDFHKFAGDEEDDKL